LGKINKKKSQKEEKPTGQAKTTTTPLAQGLDPPLAIISDKIALSSADKP